MNFNFCKLSHNSVKIFAYSYDTVTGFLKNTLHNSSPTLYIGEHSHGLYALPSLVDSSTPTITSKAGQLLLEGPIINHLQKNDYPPPSFEDNGTGSSEDPNNKIMMLGN